MTTAHAASWSSKTYGIIGAGRLGRALATAIARAGASVILGSRDPARARSRYPEIEIERVDVDCYRAAVSRSDVVLLAIAWDDLEAGIEALSGSTHKTVIDCTNPESNSETALVVGCTTSGAEVLAHRTGLPVAKAFNHLYAELLLKGPQFADTRAQGFFCGDDPSARHEARALLEGLGYEAVDTGPLSSARFLEPLAMLMVELVRGRNHPAADIAIRIVSRAPA